MNQQRNVIYSQRSDVLDGVDLKDKIHNMIISTITDAVDLHTQGPESDWELVSLRNKYMNLISFEGDFTNGESKDEITKLLVDRAIELWHSKEELFGEDVLREIERIILLRNVDEKWMDHLEAMDDLLKEIL